MSNQKSLSRSCLLGVATAVAGVLAATTAHAELINNSNGDPTAVPYVQMHTYTGIKDSQGTLPNSFVINEGILTSNNTGIATQTSVDTFTANGATVNATTSTISGGFYTARNYATMSITNANADDGYYALAGFGSMSSVQFLTPEARAQRANFTWRVTGTSTATPANQCVPSTQTFDQCATARIDFAATTSTTPDYFDVLYGGESNTMTAFGPGTYSYSIGGMPLDQTITLAYWTSAFIQINPGQLAQGGNYTFFSDYLNTYELVGVDLFDENDDLIADWSLVDLLTGDTVFTEDGKVGPPAHTPVPEPASLALFGAALVGVGFARRRRTEVARAG